MYVCAKLSRGGGGGGGGGGSIASSRSIQISYHSDSDNIYKTECWNYI